MESPIPGALCVEGYVKKSSWIWDEGSLGRGERSSVSTTLAPELALVWCSHDRMVEWVVAEYGNWKSRALRTVALGVQVRSTSTGLRHPGTWPRARASGLGCTWPSLNSDTLWQ